MLLVAAAQGMGDRTHVVSPDTKKHIKCVSKSYCFACLNNAVVEVRAWQTHGVHLLLGGRRQIKSSQRMRAQAQPNSVVQEG